jgi:GH15 family glucan-1,4-alpha-glucosidase
MTLHVINQCRDADGYADLRSYAVIGDMRTVALIAADGSIDWMPLPDLDSLPVFGRLLDAAGGGCFTLGPTGAYEMTRAYEERTNVLATTYTTATGSVRVVDAMNAGLTGHLPWGELARRIEGLTGHVEMGWRVVPGTGLNTVSPWADESGDGVVLRLDSITMALRTDEVEVSFDGSSASGRFTTAAGSRHLLALVSSRDEPLRLPAAERIVANIDHTRQRWRAWSSQFTHRGPWQDEALRNVLALRLLTHQPSGAIVAAATTSLPESADGGKNWDYRLAWLRDTSYTLHCMIAFGDFEDVHANVSWLLRVARAHDRLPVLARLDGGQPEGVTHLSVPGWRGIGPVVSGNPATSQLQLGVYGDLFDLVHSYVLAGNVLDVGTARFLADTADQVCDLWHSPDAGMWELPEYRHYTSSKMACWQALDHAVDLADRGHLTGPAHRWRQERARIRDWIEQNCWSPSRAAYTWYPGTDDLDTSVLLHARAAGFGAGERMTATLNAIREELSAGPLMYRYSGAAKQEKTFTACAFWTVTALAALGRRDEAEDLLRELLALANDVGLYSEMIDGDDASFWGNLPQALSHLAVTTAIAALTDHD